MLSRDSVTRVARRIPGAALVGLTVFVLVYVGYAHVASLVAIREHRLSGYEAPLGSLAGLGRFTSSTHGGLRHRIENGALRIEGEAPVSGRAWVRFAGPAQTLDDFVVGRARFRVVTPGAYDVFVGFLRADQDLGGEDPRRILAVARIQKDAAPSYAIDGDIAANGTRRLIARTSPVRADPPNRNDGEWHTLALTFAAYARAVFSSFDGEPTGSEPTFWFMGERIRLVFGVEAREPGADIAVEVQEAAYEQRERPAKLAAFDERFSGKLIDPRRWVVAFPDGYKAEARSSLEKGLGLHIEARSIGEAGFQTGLMLQTLPTPLDSFTITTVLEPRTLKGASFVLGVAGSGTAPQRFLDFAFRGDESGQLVPIAAGHWMGNAQVSSTAFAGPVSPAEATLAMKYDASSGQMDLRLADRIVMRPKFDLLAGDMTQFRIGVVLHAADAVADVMIRNIRLDR